jgi:hypothetical protein
MFLHELRNPTRNLQSGWSVSRFILIQSSSRIPLREPARNAVLLLSWGDLATSGTNFLVVSLLGMLLNPEDGVISYLRNVGKQRNVYEYSYLYGRNVCKPNRTKLRHLKFLMHIAI